MSEYPRHEKTVFNVDIYRMSPDCQYKILYCYNCVKCGAHTWYPETNDIAESIKNPMKCHACGDQQFTDTGKAEFGQLELFPLLIN